MRLLCAFFGAPTARDDDASAAAADDDDAEGVWQRQLHMGLWQTDHLGRGNYLRGAAAVSCDCFFLILLTSFSLGCAHAAAAAGNAGASLTLQPNTPIIYIRSELLFFLDSISHSFASSASPLLMIRDCNGCSCLHVAAAAAAADTCAFACFIVIISRKPSLLLQSDSAAAAAAAAAADPLIHAASHVIK